jgi:uncharacterized RDD family membrane protein YckC
MPKNQKSRKKLIIIIMDTISKTPNFAGLWLRCLAGFIDSILLLILFLLSTVISILLRLPFTLLSNPEEQSSNGSTIGMLISIIIFFLLAIFYFGLMESSNKQGTYGKLAVGIKVTDTEYYKISLKKAVKRRLFVILNNLTLGIGIIMIAFSKQSQALHDIWASTLVVKK